MAVASISLTDDECDSDEGSVFDVSDDSDESDASSDASDSEGDSGEHAPEQATYPLMLPPAAC